MTIQMPWHNILCRFCPFIAIFTLVFSATATAEHLPKPDRLELQDLLKAKQFEELNARLSTYQEEFESGEASDTRIDYALLAFATTNPDLSEPLDRWVESDPESEFPLLARSRYNEHHGYVSRGSYTIKYTPRERLEKMGRYLKLATSDAVNAIELNPKATVGYAILFSIAMAEGNRLEKKRLVDVALAASPTSELVRSAYLSSLVPWWGGSVAEIQAFIDRSKSTLASPEHGHALDGYAHYIRGKLAAQAGKRLEAKAHYDRALTFGETSFYYRARARNLWALREGDWGMADFRRSLELEPHNPRTLSIMASFLVSRNERDEAFRLWDLALRLDPLNPEILKKRAYQRMMTGEFDLALTDHDNALIHGALDHSNRFHRGRLNLNVLNRREAARADFQVATQVAPDTAEYWYYYAEALTEGRDSERPECPAVEAFEHYLKLCRNGESCKDTYVTTAEYFTTVRTEFYGSC